MPPRKAVRTSAGRRPVLERAQNHEKTIRDHDGSPCVTLWYTTSAYPTIPWWTIQIYTIIPKANQDYDISSQHVKNLAALLENEYFGGEHAGRGGALQVWDRIEVHGLFQPSGVPEEEIVRNCIEHQVLEAEKRTELRIQTWELGSRTHRGFIIIAPDTPDDWDSEGMLFVRFDPLGLPRHEDDQVEPVRVQRHTGREAIRSAMYNVRAGVFWQRVQAQTEYLEHDSSAFKAIDRQFTPSSDKGDSEDGAEY